MSEKKESTTEKQEVTSDDKAKEVSIAIIGGVSTVKGTPVPNRGLAKIEQSIEIYHPNDRKQNHLIQLAALRSNFYSHYHYTNDYNHDFVHIFRGFFAGLIGKRVYFGGGTLCLPDMSFGECNHAIGALNSFDLGSQFLRRAKWMLQPRYNAASAVLNKKLYFCGGDGFEKSWPFPRRLKSCECFVPDPTRPHDTIEYGYYEQVPDLPSWNGVASLTMSTDGKSLFAIGGVGGIAMGTPNAHTFLPHWPTNKIWRLNPVESTWKEIWQAKPFKGNGAVFHHCPQFNQPRYIGYRSHASSAFLQKGCLGQDLKMGDCIWVCGGFMKEMGPLITNGDGLGVRPDGWRMVHVEGCDVLLTGSSHLRPLYANFSGERLDEPGPICKAREKVPAVSGAALVAVNGDTTNEVLMLGGTTQTTAFWWKPKPIESEQLVSKQVWMFKRGKEKDKQVGKPVLLADMKRSRVGAAAFLMEN